MGREKAYQRIVDAVECDIAEGRLAPGDHLPSEREMVQRFEVSRASVREALRVLENSGLVRSRHGDRSGPVVLNPAGPPLATTMARVARLTGASLGELVGYRMALESAANRLAARLRTEEHLAGMRDNLAEMRRRIDDGADAFGPADFAFHELIAEAGGNRLIQASLDAVRGAVVAHIGDRIVQSADAHAQMRESLRHHEAVYAAIESQDPDRAGSIARASLYAYYAALVSPEERTALAELREHADLTL